MSSGIKFPDYRGLLPAEDTPGGGPGQLLLSLDGPITPLVIRSPRSLLLLMPVRI